MKPIQYYIGTVSYTHLNQLVYGIDRTVLSEYQEISCQRGDAVGGYPERNGHRSRREFVTTDQQPPGHTGESTGNTISRDVFKIGHVHYRDPVTAYGKFRIEGYRLILCGDFNRDIIKTPAVKTVRRFDDTFSGSTFRTGSQGGLHVQNSVGSVSLKTVERADVAVKHGLRV